MSDIMLNVGYNIGLWSPMRLPGQMGISNYRNENLSADSPTIMFCISDLPMVEYLSLYRVEHG